MRLGNLGDGARKELGLGQWPCSVPTLVPAACPGFTKGSALLSAVSPHVPFSWPTSFIHGEGSPRLLCPGRELRFLPLSLWLF